MPKTLLGKFLFYFIGTAACTTLLLDGLECLDYWEDHFKKKRLEVSKGENNDETICENPD